MSDIKERIGMRFKSNNYGWFEVIGRGGYKYVIRFDHAGYETVAAWREVCEGAVRNPFWPSVCGVGYLGEAERKHPFYKRWSHMLARCHNPDDKNYQDYGGRGISVDPSLHSLERYIEYVESLPGHDDPELDTIDRIDNDGDYEPSNLRWASQKEQRANQRRRSDQRDFIATGPDGVEHLGKSQRGFARRHGLDDRSLNKCLKGRSKTHKGWTFRYKEAPDEPTTEDFTQKEVAEFMSCSVRTIKSRVAELE